jgi:hypothetical protein
VTTREFFYDTRAFGNLDHSDGLLGLRALTEAAIELMQDTYLPNGEHVPVMARVRYHGQQEDRSVEAALNGVPLMKMGEQSLLRLIVLDSEAKLHPAIERFLSQEVPSLLMTEVTARAVAVLEETRSMDLLLEIIRATYSEEHERADALLQEAIVAAQHLQEKLQGVPREGTGS